MFAFYRNLEFIFLISLVFRLTFIHALFMDEAEFTMMRFWSNLVPCSFIVDSDSRNLGATVWNEKICSLCLLPLAPQLEV